MAPSVDRRGVEPRLPGCKPSVLPLNEQPIYFKRSVRESNPVPLLTTEVCCRNTYRPSSDPGWNRTISLLGVIQASSPLDHGIMSVTEAGVEPAKSRGSRPRRFACLRTRPWRVRVSLPAVQAHEARLGAGPPAIKLQAPVSNRAHRPYGSQLGTCQACNRVTKGRVELPRPQGARRSERRASTYSATSPSQAARTGVEPVSRE